MLDGPRPAPCRSLDNGTGQGALKLLDARRTDRGAADDLADDPVAIAALLVDVGREPLAVAHVCPRYTAAAAALTALSIRAVSVRGERARDNGHPAAA